MGDLNLSAVLYQKGDLRMEETEVPTPKHGEVLLAVHSVSICASDVHYWTHGSIGDFVVDKPMILGHEMSGTVVELGPGVTSLKKGDRVAVEPGVPCRLCELCCENRYNLCPEVKFCATPPYDGSLRRYFATPADFCFKLPDAVSHEEGALLEPLSVAIHACRRGGVKKGSRVLVCGSGPIGLVSAITAKAMGAAVVCNTDIAENRLEVAKRIDADHTVLVKSRDPTQVANSVRQTMGCMPDVTIECTGVESSIQSAIYATRAGGVVVLVGLSTPEVKLPIVNAAVREVDIRGVFRYAHTYPAAVQLVASGAVNLKPLVTHRFKLEDTLKAFETSKTTTSGAIKVVIQCART